jgi:hypothetical protein|tara:strand:+ start:226 stop:732 length:507 start_codon:yes stop_codon:yes gene_type:complete
MALTKVQAEGINLADTFAFTGSVSGVAKILQVKSSGNITTEFLTDQETYQTMNCTVDITPSATTSKILVLGNVSGFYLYGGGTDAGAAGAIYRDSSAVYAGGANRFAYIRDTSSGNLELGIPLTLQHLDSPSTTSSVTYGLYMRAFSGATVRSYSGYSRSIIAIEVAQ